MRKSVMGASVALALSIAPIVQADVVADYQDDFSYPAPASGWSYLWNANGPIGTAANYVPLVPDGASPARYETQNQTPDQFPDDAPGASLSATLTTLVPGRGTNQSGNPIERYVIAAYTFSAADVATNGEQLVLDDFSFAVGAGSDNGVTATMYLNDFPLIAAQPLGPGLEWHVGLTGPIGLGPVSPGDTFYVAIGADGLAPLPPFGPGGSDIGDVITVDYSLVLVPEPGSAAVLAAGVTQLLFRRRRHRR
jgi:hypothetical protein